MSLTNQESLCKFKILRIYEPPEVREVKTTETWQRILTSGELRLDTPEEARSQEPEENSGGEVEVLRAATARKFTWTLRCVGILERQASDTHARMRAYACIELVLFALLSSPSPCLLVSSLLSNLVSPL